MTTRQVRSYASRTTTTTIESVAITSGNGGTSLGTFGVELNHSHRVSYGSNNYKESAMRQFLNSSAAAGSVWTPQTKFDRPPSWLTTIAGFAAGLTQEFLAVVGDVILPCAANNTYEAPDSIEFGNLYKAMKKACRNVRWKDSVVGYEANGLKNTYLLRQDLLQGKYEISPYQHFIIHEPKKREIVATRIRDRQFQKSLCDAGLYEDIVEHLIHDDGACQTGKGTDFTLDRMIAHLRRYFNESGSDGWVLKCDIRKFFPSAPHSVAKSAIDKRVSDANAARAMRDVVDSFDGEIGIGLPKTIT